MRWDQHCCEVFYSRSSQAVLMPLVHYGNSERDGGGWCFVKKTLATVGLRQWRRGGVIIIWKIYRSVLLARIEARAANAGPLCLIMFTFTDVNLKKKKKETSEDDM